LQSAAGPDFYFKIRTGAFFLSVTFLLSRTALPRVAFPPLFPPVGRCVCFNGFVNFSYNLFFPLPGWPSMEWSPPDSDKAAAFFFGFRLPSFFFSFFSFPDCAILFTNFPLLFPYFCPERGASCPFSRVVLFLLTFQPPHPCWGP